VCVCGCIYPQSTHMYLISDILKVF